MSEMNDTHLWGASLSQHHSFDAKYDYARLPLSDITVFKRRD